MSCEAASNNATPPSSAIAPGAEDIDTRRFAADLGEGRHVWHGGRGIIDPRIVASVPGFDAPFFQAGLAGYSDAAMRLIARRHGCPFCVTEALLDRTLLAGGRGFTKADLGELHDNVPGGADDHPLAGQIMGSEPAEMAAAALKMIEQGARSEREYRRLAYNGALAPGQESTLRLPGGEQIEWVACGEAEDDAEAPACGGANAPRRQGVAMIPSDGEPHAQRSSQPLPTRQPDPSAPSFAAIDVNLACPVKKIASKARGGHWLAEPEGAIRLLEAVREALPPSVLCTVKLRRSFDDSPEMVENLLRIYDAAYDMGYAWATVHARTVEQKYVGPSRWTFLRELRRRNPERIFFGSGDVWSVHDIFRMIRYAGVSAVSVARGCIGNPWVFKQARDMIAGLPPSPPTVAQQRWVLDNHFRLLLAVNRRMRRGEEASSRMMRKFAIRFAEHHPRKGEVRQRVIGVESLADWNGVLAEFYSDAEGVGGAPRDATPAGR